MLAFAMFMSVCGAVMLCRGRMWSVVQSLVVVGYLKW